MNREELNSSHEAMIETQLKPRGINNPAVIKAFQIVPREKFMPIDKQEYAYIDAPVAIGAGQTISQPYTVALMTQLLEPKIDDKILEIGGGSGYQAAILANIATSGHIYTIERLSPLAKAARETLNQLGYQNIDVHVGDGTSGLSSLAPFDGIIVTAAAPSAPKPLLEQLNTGGRMVIPIGPRHSQEMTRITKVSPDQLKTETFGGFIFVPLIGEHGWHE